MTVNCKKNSKKAVAVVAGLIICLFTIISLHTSTYLIIREYNGVGNNQVLMIPVALDDPVAIEYTHSVFKTQVRDVFKIVEPELLMLEETIYESMGIGLPTNTTYEFSLTDGKFHIRGINKAMEDILLRVGRIANHMLLVREKRISLKEYFSPQTLLKITAEKKHVYQYWLREKKHDRQYE